MRLDESPCSAFAEDLSALVDAELAPARAAEVRTHVAACAACTRALAELRDVDAWLLSAPMREVPADLRVRLQSRIAEDGASRRVATAAPRRRSRWLARPAVAVALAAAAVVALAIAFGDGLLPDTGEPVRTDVVQARPAPRPEPDVERLVERPTPDLQVAKPTGAPPVPAPAPVLPPDRLPVVVEKEIEVALADDAAVDELALTLELDTIEDLDVIANLDLLERLLALEEGTG